MLYALIFVFFTSAILAQEDAPTPHPNPLSIEPQPIEDPIERYQKNPLTIELKLVDGYKAYLDQFRLSSEDVNFSSLEVTPSIVFYDKFFNREREGLIGQGQLSAQFELPKDIATGPQTLDGTLTYQACTDDFCLLPKHIAFQFSLDLPEDKNEQTVFGFNQALEKGFFTAFLLVFVAGLLTSLTPCVYPMIPITLSILGTQVIGQSQWRGFLISLSYVLGIGISYASLGVMVAKTGSLFGSILANPFVITSIAILFLLIGLGMYGVFEIQTPQWISKKLDRHKTRRGLKGAFFAGLISGIVTNPCIGPVLIGILTYVSQTQDIFLGFSLLFTFAMGLGVLFLLLGTFSQCLNWLPSSGPWMEGIKFFFGTTMVAMAFYYLHPLLETHLFYLLLGLTCFLLGGLLFCRFKRSLPKLFLLEKGIVFSFCLVGVLILALATQKFFAEVKQTPTDKADSKPNNMQWKVFTEELFQEGLSQNRPIIIDFTAQWCTVCKALETHTFSDLSVQMASKKFLLLKIDATLETKDVAKWTSDFQVLGLPTVLFYNPAGVLQKDLTLTNFEEPKAFLQRMNKTLQ